MAENNVRKIYTRLRRECPHMSAQSALTHAKHSANVEKKVRKLGLRWKSGIGRVTKTMQWSEGVMLFTARVEIDEDGEWLVDDLGHFTDNWEEGAIKHSSDPRKYTWFVPEAGKEEPEVARQQYKRAISYGDDWYYCHLSVEVSVNGISLYIQPLSGVVSDAGEEYFMETALDLATEAKSRAKEELQALCETAEQLGID